MTKIAKRKFDNVFSLNYMNEQNQTNLQCICVEETQESVVITAYPSLTFIKKSLVFRKNSKIFSSMTPFEV